MAVSRQLMILTRHRNPCRKKEKSFKQFCLMTGIESLIQMINKDVIRLAGICRNYNSADP